LIKPQPIFVGVVAHYILKVPFRWRNAATPPTALKKAFPKKGNMIFIFDQSTIFIGLPTNFVLSNQPTPAL
jgi:hypothetical protein